MVVINGRGTDFPVMFFDGEREMKIGNVKITAGLEYKTFQLMLSQKIGISPNQISIYLVDRKKSRNAKLPDDRRRTPITAKVDFGLICCQKDCCFLVVLKRSRKTKNRRERVNEVEFSDSSPSPVLENVILLRRNQPVPFYDQITHLNDRLENLRIMRDDYQMAVATSNPSSTRNLYTGYDPSPDLEMSFFPGVQEIYRVSMMTKNENTDGFFCEVCVDAKNYGGTTSFHPCVNDVVIGQFRTLVGPISRPAKSPQ